MLGDFEEHTQPLNDNLEEFSKLCCVCGRSVPKGKKYTIYCCGECEFHAKNSLGSFMIGDHPELVEKRIYTT